MSKKKKENFFQLIIKHSSDAILDNKGIIRFLNPAAEYVFNRRAKEMIGQVFGFPIHKGGSKEKDDTRCSKKERGTMDPIRASSYGASDGRWTMDDGRKMKESIVLAQRSSVVYRQSEYRESIIPWKGW